MRSEEQEIADAKKLAQLIEEDQLLAAEKTKPRKEYTLTIENPQDADSRCVVKEKRKPNYQYPAVARAWKNQKYISHFGFKQFKKVLDKMIKGIRKQDDPGRFMDMKEWFEKQPGMDPERQAFAIKAMEEEFNKAMGYFNVKCPSCGWEGLNKDLEEDVLGDCCPSCKSMILD